MRQNDLLLTEVGTHSAYNAARQIYQLRQWSNHLNTLNDQIILVTGANAGIGLETARALAQRGATVVMVARSAERGAVARDDVIASTGNQKTTLMLCDLASQASIRAFAAEFKARYDRLDVLVNNAGAIFNSRQESVDGIELTFALNHLGYFLLTNELLDLLKASAPARIVNVSSGAHSVGKFDFDDYQRRQRYSGFQVYGESKMANVLFTYELARRLEGTGVTANVLHPGFVRTNFATNNGRLWALGMQLIGRLFAISPTKGAETPIYLASSPDVAGVSGQYFDKCKAVKSHSYSHNREAQRRLWALSAQLTATPDPVAAAA